MCRQVGRGHDRGDAVAACERRYLTDDITGTEFGEDELGAACDDDGATGCDDLDVIGAFALIEYALTRRI